MKRLGQRLGRLLVLPLALTLGAAPLTLSGCTDEPDTDVDVAPDSPADPDQEPEVDVDVGANAANE